MTALADEMVPWFELLLAETKEKMERRIKKAGGVGGGAKITGFNDNDREPESGGQPDFPDIFLKMSQRINSQCSLPQASYSAA